MRRTWAGMVAKVEYIHEEDERYEVWVGRSKYIPVFLMGNIKS